MKRHLPWLVIGGLLMAAMFAACGGDGDKGEPNPTAAAPTGAASPTATGPSFPFEGPLGIDLTTYGVFHTQGQQVRLTIAVAASEPGTLYYRTTQRYDITITDSEDKEVWRWSKDKSFDEVPEEVSINAGGSLTFGELWDQRDNEGQPVPPGNYRITAISTHCDANYENCGTLSVTRPLQIRAA